MRFCWITTCWRSTGTDLQGTAPPNQTPKRWSTSNLPAPSTPSSWTGRLSPSSTLWEPKLSNRYSLFKFFFFYSCFQCHHVRRRGCAGFHSSAVLSIGILVVYMFSVELERLNSFSCHFQSLSEFVCLQVIKQYAEVDVQVVIAACSRKSSRYYSTFLENHRSCY